MAFLTLSVLPRIREELGWIILIVGGEPQLASGRSFRVVIVSAQLELQESEGMAGLDDPRPSGSLTR